MASISLEILSYASIIALLAGLLVASYIIHAAKRKDNIQLSKTFKLLEESELKYRALFENSIDPILIIGPQKTFIDCNISALGILEYPDKKDFIGSPPHKISPKFQMDGQLSEIKAAEMIALAHKNGFHHFEWMHITATDKPFYVEVSLTVVHIRGEQLLHVLWHDITEVLETKKELLVAKEKAIESDKLKSAFLANMSHEVRTPMNSILGFSQLLSLPSITEDERRIYADLIGKSGNQLLSILDNIMDMSTIEAGLMKIKEAEVNINFLMEDKHQQFISRTHAKGLRLILQKGLEDKYAQVIVDPIRLGQVLDFLMDNATKFTETGHIIFGYGIGDESLKFFVQDSGIGIDRSHMNNIFNRFRQGHDPKNSQYGGTGLGLSISKAIIENMSGDIYFSSTVGKGSTFYFSIPYKKAKPSSLLRNRSASSKPKAVSK